MNQTIQTTKGALQEYFKTEEVIYQAKVGYFVHLNVNGLVVKEATKFVESLGLEISMVRSNNASKLSLFLEFA